MEELEYIKNERLKAQEEYFKNAKNVWVEFDGVEADKKYKKVYNEYRNKDYFLILLIGFYSFKLKPYIFSIF